MPIASFSSCLRVYLRRSLPTAGRLSPSASQDGRRVTTCPSMAVAAGRRHASRSGRRGRAGAGRRSTLRRASPTLWPGAVTRWHGQNGRSPSPRRGGRTRPARAAARGGREGGNDLLVEDYAERVRTAAGYLTRLLGDAGDRIDSPEDEPLGPPGAGAVELGDVTLLPVGFAPAPGVTMTAVDGGSACLVNGRSFWVIAFRAGWVRHR